jgi:glycosyltransferase involved in cell wall biosynthesis
MPEIIEDGVNGFLVDTLEEAVAAVAKVGDLDRHTVRRSVERRFSVGRMADDYLALYRSILAGERGANAFSPMKRDRQGAL